MEQGILWRPVLMGAISLHQAGLERRRQACACSIYLPQTNDRSRIQRRLWQSSATSAFSVLEGPEAQACRRPVHKNSGTTPGIA